MEITCQQCNTVFVVDPGGTPAGTIEVVCPGCFALQSVALQSAQPSLPPLAGPGLEAPRSPLGDGGVVDRLRDGFTLHFEVRHPSWTEVRRLNPYEIKRLLYQRELDGREEYREHVGRWMALTEHPEFSLVLQLLQPGRSSGRTRDDIPVAGGRLHGWRGSAQTTVPVPTTQVSTELPLEAPVAPRLPSRLLLISLVLGGILLGVGLAIGVWLLLR